MTMTGYFSKQQQQRQRQKYPSYQEIRIGMNAAATASSFYGNAFSADDSCWCRIGGGIVCFYRRMWLEFVELASRENTSPLRLWPTETEIPTAYDYELSLAGKYIALEDLIKEEVEEEGRSKCKFILVSNTKEDDPVVWKDIPEFILLAAKYGRSG